MMSDESVDMMAGLNAVVAILEAIRVDERAIGPVDRVRLASLQWAMNKLADDLHKADVEIRNARLEVVSARREADDAREARDAARQLHLVECRKYNAEVERRMALERQVAELTAERDSLKRQWDDLEKSFVQSMQPTMTSVVQLVEAAEATAVEVIKKPAELPAEPAPEPYQWQVGDEIAREDGTIHIITRAIGGLLWFKDQTTGGSAQWWLAENGYRLHRKALPRLQPRHVPLDEDLPDIPPPTPQQVAEFAAVTEPIDDDEEQEEEIVTLAEWALVTSEPKCSEWTPGRWDGESDGIGQVTMFRTGSTTERYLHNARIPVRDLRAAGINLGEWLRFREVLVCGESGKQEYRFEIRQCDQPASDSVGTDGEGQS
jgi:hypothetical protein